ncbi:SWIM-type domain-containing protein, partial [Aphis craccivora]
MGKRSLKITGSCKIDQCCPSFIRIEVTDNNIDVTYCKTHLGHQNDIKFLPIPSSVQGTIADKIINGVPSNVIIDQIRDNFDNKIEKKNIITRKDVYNISTKFGLLHKYKLHDIDALSLDLQVKRFAESSSNPIVFYKTQGTEYPPLDFNDFMLIILTETQKAVLHKFSNGKLCIDSTHGTNQYNFNLTSIVVIDEFRERYPAAFCISTKIDEVHMKEVISCLTPNVFMSDDAPAFWNAWINIMWPIPQHHLLYYFYKTLRVLLEEPNETQFEELLNFFLEEPALHNFKTYFERTYLHRKKLWAACYRHEVMLNINMVLEAFHKTLKHVYLKGKKNQRLDVLL